MLFDISRLASPAVPNAKHQLTAGADHIQHSETDLAASAHSALSCF